MTTRAKVCRICMTGTTKGVISLFSVCNGSIRIYDKVMEVANVQISEEDGLPVWICYSCLVHLETSYQFKIQAEKSDQLFRNQLEASKEADVVVIDDNTKFLQAISNIGVQCIMPSEQLPSSVGQKPSVDIESENFIHENTTQNDENTNQEHFMSLSKGMGDDHSNDQNGIKITNVMSQAEQEVMNMPCTETCTCIEGQDGTITSKCEACTKVLTKLKIKNVNIIGKQKRYSSQEEDDILQIAGSHNPEIEEPNNDVFLEGEVMDTTENFEAENILRKKELARERSRKYRKKMSMGLIKIEEILRRRKLETERKRKYREQKKSRELTEHIKEIYEKISRKRELSKERSRKYREKKRLENWNSNVILHSQIAGPSQLPDNPRLEKQLTIHHSQVARPPRMPCSPIHMDVIPEIDWHFLLTESTKFKMENKKKGSSQEDDILQTAGSHNPEIEELNNDVFLGGEVMNTTENFETEKILRERELAREMSMGIIKIEEIFRRRRLEAERKYCEQKTSSELIEHEEISRKENCQKKGQGNNVKKNA